MFIRGEKGGAAFGYREVEIVVSEVVVQGVEVFVCVEFHCGDVSASGDDVDVISVLGEGHVGVGWGWDVMHIEIKKDGRYDRALWNAKMNVPMGGEGMLEKNLLFSTVEVIAKEFGGGFWEGGLQEFYFERGEVDSVEGLSEV